LRRIRPLQQSRQQKGLLNDLLLDPCAVFVHFSKAASRKDCMFDTLFGAFPQRFWRVFGGENNHDEINSVRQTGD